MHVQTSKFTLAPAPRPAVHDTAGPAPGCKNTCGRILPYCWHVLGVVEREEHDGDPIWIPPSARGIVALMINCLTPKRLLFVNQRTAGAAVVFPPLHYAESSCLTIVWNNVIDSMEYNLAWHARSMMERKMKIWHDSNPALCGIITWYITKSMFCII